MKKQKIEKTARVIHGHSNQEGITLVALVITVIVLLILAGVAINAVVGDNGILNQATGASQKHKAKSEIELAETKIEWFTEGENAGKVDLEETRKAVIKLDEVDENETKIEGNTLKIKFKDGETHDIKGVFEEQISYLDYDDVPLPKFTLNPDPSELLENTALLETIVEEIYEHGEYRGGQGQVPFFMTNEEGTSGVQVTYYKDIRRRILY